MHLDREEEQRINSIYGKWEFLAAAKVSVYVRARARMRSIFDFLQSLLQVNKPNTVPVLLIWEDRYHRCRRTATPSFREYLLSLKSGCARR